MAKLTTRERLGRLFGRQKDPNQTVTANSPGPTNNTQQVPASQQQIATVIAPQTISQSPSGGGFLSRLFGGSKSQASTTVSAPTNLSQGPSLQSTEGSKLNLINYSPEELVQHVEHSLSRVQFGWSRTAKWMEGFSEFWSWIGPIILLLGTVGEVVLVLWIRQKNQDILAGMSIVAVALVLEGTFLAVSYKAARIRNRAERNPGGPTDLDKKKLQRQFFFWFALALGVCATQIIFIVAQTKDEGIGKYGVWAFAGLRAFFTLVADGYTAFAHEEHPTTGQKALEEQEQRADLAKKFLTQKKQEVSIINEGIQEVRAIAIKAQMEDLEQKTMLEVKQLESKSRVETLRTQQEQATMFTNLSGNMMRALFDPSLPEGDRDRLLGTMQGFMSAMKYLPQPQTVRIEEEEDL